MNPKFLIIQTAFIGDVVLATSVVEKLHAFYPDARIDFLLRKGNEGLLHEHPFIKKLWVWDKKKNKRFNLLKIIAGIRREQYTHVINLHRFATSGIVTALSGARERLGFDKNPLSFTFTHKYPHVIDAPYTDNPQHEVARNQSLIAHLTDDNYALPKLYPPTSAYDAVASYKAQPYVCISPASAWFTKQYPPERWVELINNLPQHLKVYLLGGGNDAPLAEQILKSVTPGRCISLCGKLNFLQSAALMQDAVMNYANDSAPLHFCTAMGAPVTAVFCSTVPAFGFGPLGQNARIAEYPGELYCRPCGLHGRKACPEGHFKCANDITQESLLWWTLKKTSGAA